MNTLEILGDVWVAAVLPIFQPELCFQTRSTWTQFGNEGRTLRSSFFLGVVIGTPPSYSFGAAKSL
jgi:hypothetical protein